MMVFQVEVLRLLPGEDLRGALEAVFRGIRARGVEAACVVSAVGSLSQAVLRYADAPEGTTLAGPLELMSLSGTLSRDGPHLHAMVADAQGQVRRGSCDARLRGAHHGRTGAGAVAGLAIQPRAGPGHGFYGTGGAAPGRIRDFKPNRPLAQDWRALVAIN
jgi:hypothetical protein